jgi:GNAT superfamily N-acetyltransferase
VIAHRPATAADRTFVCSSWVDSYRTSYAAGILDMQAWHSIMWPQVERYLDRPTVRTVVAVERKDPTFLYGFICADLSPQVEHLDAGRTKSWPAMLLYVYVKAPYRRDGIARGLFEHIGLDPRSPFLYACKTPIAGRLAPKIPLAKWNPLVARFQKERAA